MNRQVLASLVCAAALLCGCSTDDPVRPDEDAVPPAAISDLDGTGLPNGDVRLIWTAPGDDGLVGRARAYDLRWSGSTITMTTWDSDSLVDSVPVPKFSGHRDTCYVTGLPQGTVFLAIRTADEVPNWSALSNVVSLESSDSIAPVEVSDLRAVASELDTVTLSWTAPGDDGQEGQAFAYSLRYATLEISEANWDDAHEVEDLPTPSPSGIPETHEVTGLLPATTYHFALRTADEAGNWSGLSNDASRTTVGMRQITFFPASRTSSPEWSPSGDQIVFVSDHQAQYDYELHSIDVRTGEIVQLTSRTGASLHPAWSPDGSRIAFVGYEDFPEVIAEIWTIEPVPGAVPTRVTTLGNSNIAYLDWSPDGQRFAYVVMDRSVSPWTYDLFVVRSDGSQPELLLGGQSRIAGISWHPSALSVAVAGSVNGSRNIWAIPVDGGQPVELTHEVGECFSPAWSPDGSRLAYGYANSVCVMTDGQDPLRLTPDDEVMYGQPSWAPDGHALAMTGWISPFSNLWVLTME